MAEWHFASGEGITPRGPNNGEIDTFKGAPIRSLAREICQNSLDALLPEEKEKRSREEAALPVVVEFHSFEGVVPEKQKLLESVERMLDYWKGRQKKDMTVVDFLNGVIDNLKKSKVPFLRISDRNTTGLCGIGEDGSPWDNLVMTVGASDKAPDDGGSKGVGHAAPFACSSLQTVFYFTKNDEGQQAFEGVARLVGWKEGSMGFEEIGYFGDGEVGKQPLNNRFAFGDEYDRKDTGSDIYIGGFNQTDWKDDVVQSALDSFLLAIYQGKIELKVADRYISNQNLAETIAIQSEKGLQFVNHADQYYKVLTSAESKKFEKEITQAGMRGKFVLRLLIDPSLDVKRVALVRDTGMLILERDHISSSVKFAGVLEVVGKELNAFLRRLENGQHTEWSAARAKQEDQSKAKALLKSIGEFCRAKLHEMTVITPGEMIDSGLGNTSNAENNRVEDSSEEEDVNDELKPITGKQRKKAPVETGKRKKKRKIKRVDDPGAGTEINPHGHGGKGKGRPTIQGGGIDAPESNTPKVDWIDVNANELDCVCIDKRQSEYQIVFKPDAGFQSGRVTLSAMAETENYNADIVSARLANGQSLTIENGNEIHGLGFVKGEPVSLFVKLDYPDYCSLEVELDGHN